MGNKILGQRSRSFYRGFNAQQLQYLRQKFESISSKGVLDAPKFMGQYKIEKEQFQKFVREADLQESGGVDCYQFICLVSSLCNLSVQQLGCKLFAMFGNERGLSPKDLLSFTTVCLTYNAYLRRQPAPTKQELERANTLKFKKYDFDKNKVIQKQQFVSICLKDEDYKRWLYNMGFITRSQRDLLQDAVYDLIDSDVAEQVERHEERTNPSDDGVRQGIAHRVNDKEFIGRRGGRRPWQKSKFSAEEIERQIERKALKNPPAQLLTLQHVYGYRSFDCRNNARLDSRGNVIYHQGAVGIHISIKGEQSFLLEHKDDICCLDVVEDMVVTGQSGTKPMIVLWGEKTTNRRIPARMLVTEGLSEGVGTVRVSGSKRWLAATCNDLQHTLVVYSMAALEKANKEIGYGKSAVVGRGALTKAIVFDMQFSINESMIVVATLKEILFVNVSEVINSSRGIYDNFAPCMALCLLPLRWGKQQFMLAGMDNGSIYFWEQEKCVRALFGHMGSVSALANREKGFLSGDKYGKVILWSVKLEKEREFVVGQGSMVLTISESMRKILVGNKEGTLYLCEDNKKSIVMEGHNKGILWGLAMGSDSFFTGGDDKKLVKWMYRPTKGKMKEVRCASKIRCLDSCMGTGRLLVGYRNGVLQLYSHELQRQQATYRAIINADIEVLTVVRMQQSGKMAYAAYCHPDYRVGVFEVSDRQMRVLSWTVVGGAVLSMDLGRKMKEDVRYFRVNTSDYDYGVYAGKGDKYVRVESKEGLRCVWATHSVALSPQTQGVINEDVDEGDITCCGRSRKKHVFVVGDRFGHLKLMNYPSIGNSIYNKYEGHSSPITALDFDLEDKFMVSIGGQEKAIMLWNYDSKAVDNQQFEQTQQDTEDGLGVKKRKDEKQGKVFDEFQACEVEGQQALACNQFKGQIKAPTNVQLNARRDNQLPKVNARILHAFGVRNSYLKDQVRSQCRFSRDFKEAVYPTACLLIRCDLKSRRQEILLQHREDIVSLAMDGSRTLVATGQMAEKNEGDPRQKIVSVCVWNVVEGKLIKRLDGFHTVAVVVVGFSPSGKLLFTCGNDSRNSFAVWDWRLATVLYSGPVSGGKVNGVVWRSQHEFMTCGEDHVKVWNEGKGRLCRVNAGKGSRGYQSMVCCITSKDIYVSGSKRGNLFNWLGNESSAPIPAHSGKVQCLCVDSTFLYSGGDDGKIFRWKLQLKGSIVTCDLYYDVAKDLYGKMKMEYSQEQLSVLSMDLSDRNDLLLVTRGCSVVLHEGGKSKVVNQGHYKGQLWGLACNGKGVWTGGDDGTIRMWQLNDLTQMRRQRVGSKIRAVDVHEHRLIAADENAVVYLYDAGLEQRLCKYTGAPYESNKGEVNRPWVQEIKFDPRGQMAVYGTHGKSQVMEVLRVEAANISLRKRLKGGSSALLHVDWSQDSSSLSINTQAAELLFLGADGRQMSASSCRDTKWSTWTQKFGWASQGIFQGVDYSDVNTVSRHPGGAFMAVGYDDQTIRLFKYPCYIEKQVHRVLYGHSSHVTRVRFTPNHMLSIGGLDRTLLVWELSGLDSVEEQGDESDGLDDLDEEIDLNSRITKGKKKRVVMTQFPTDEGEGDEFTAVKPWLGAIKEPTYKYPVQSVRRPKSELQLEYVYGYRVKDCRQNVYYVDRQNIIYHAAAVLIQHEMGNNKQTLAVDADDDILSIAYNRNKTIAVTGSLGPRPLLNVYCRGVRELQLKSVVTKGIVAVAISPEGGRVVCVGMDDNHEVGVVDVEGAGVVAKAKGGRKAILRLAWVNEYEFVSVGIKHYRYWTLEKNVLKGQNGVNYGDQTFVSLAVKGSLILSGGSNGLLVLWKRDKGYEMRLRKQGEEQNASVVESIVIDKDNVVAGTKDGLIFVLTMDLKKKSVLNVKNVLRSKGLKSQNVSVRSIDILQNKWLVGTFGGEIFQLQMSSERGQEVRQVRCVMRSHYSPNNTWTNQVWGLCTKDDVVFTCADDATVRCWSVSKRIMLGSTSLNVSKDRLQLQRDPKTKDFVDAAKGRCVGVSPQDNCIVVGAKNGTLRVFQYQLRADECVFRLLDTLMDAKQCISDIKFGCNVVVVGSHNNSIYVYDYQQKKLKLRYKPLRKHSSYITHLDISRDSCFLQSSCGAYELLFWDLNEGRQITSGGTLLRDERWATWTSNIGWAVQGIYPKCTDGTFIHSVARSATTLLGTSAMKDETTPALLAAGNNKGEVVLYHYPCTIKNTEYASGLAHSSHVTTVRWTPDDRRVLSVGGEDQCLIQWVVNRKK